MKLLYMLSLIFLLSEPSKEEYIIYSKALTAINTPYFTPPKGSEIKARPIEIYQFYVIDKSINDAFGFDYDEKDTTDSWSYPIFLRDTLKLSTDIKWLKLLKDFGNKKLSNITLKENFETPFKIELLSSLNLPKTKKTSVFWDRYKKKYPKSAGFIRLSEIVYSLEKDRAMFYYERHSNPLNAVGGLVFMQKRNDTWFFVYMGELWVS